MCRKLSQTHTHDYDSLDVACFYICFCSFVFQAIDCSSSASDSTVVNPKATKAPPTGRAVEEREDEEEEEGGENNGEVPNEIVAGKQEEASSQDGGTAAPSERTQQKPPFSYAQLIVQALLAAKDRRQTLSNIYAFIADMYPYYKLGEKGWKVRGGGGKGGGGGGGCGGEGGGGREGGSTYYS